jgi:hypothetical protein
VLDRAREGVDEQNQASGDGSCAGGVEPPMAERGPALAEEYRGQGEHDCSGGDVDEEDPRPVEGARQHTSEQDAGRGAATRGGSPDPEGKIALAAFRKRRGQDGQSCGREQRCSQSLETTETDERALGPGQTVEKRADGEKDESDDENAPAPEQVGEPTAE